MNPKVSIIIPNYNHAPFLVQRLESIFNQTFQDFEVILLDDKSTDDGVTVLERYAKHPKVSHFVVNEQNSGSPFKQWQKGIELAQGDYIWIAESDDFCESIFLENLVGLLSNQNTVLAYCATLHFDEINNNKYRDTWATELDRVRWNDDYCNKGVDEIKNYFRFRNIIPNASAALFKKNAIAKIELPTAMKYCGDWYVWINLLKHGDIAYVNKPLNFYRKHLNTTRVFKALKDEKIRFGEYFKIINENSNIVDRWRYLKNYKWIVLECYLKQKTIGNYPNLKLKLPLEFQWVYFIIGIQKRFNK